MRDARVIESVLAERTRQRELGHLDEYDYPDGTADVRQWVFLPGLDAVRALSDSDRPSWALVLLEEVLEVLAESDTARIREELVQVAAVAVRWAGAIDVREGE